MRSATFFFTFLSILFAIVLPVAGQECTATKKCATGCCSKFGFCGTGKDHCGDGCLSTCDFKLGCDADHPCADGTCCSKFGFCGFGKDFCSPENCVAGCNAKSQCDPGSYGADYVELKKCPLNVCCSKWGYCGATAEFCGDRKVKRPSCAVGGDTPVNRVVGYYEGWAARRSCQAFMPEDVPMGVYTHLNFAFAGIDPRTYEIVPAQIEDVALYTRLTDLKKFDSSLKVYIAIGGWTFNDPGPTFHTFSELAADPAKQAVFFKSLISFLTTYNFDGVDIDWEYPTTSERGGHDADYANYPAFMRNLRAALDAGSGGRNGVSATLPVSFWYLRHFDIVELEKWVDFFNIMSYDLHGLWDKGNKWVGAYLNSHTNMTEITEYLDLFWRNDIKPEKINLGLAFYSRTFLAADPGCTHAQCMFDSVGEAGPCSKDDIGGSLTNAELIDQIRAAGVKPTLDKDAMVKMAVIGRKWITYDDQDTFKLKVDAARSMCIGGVMVWAVSQDYTDGSAKVAAAVGKSNNKKRDDSGIYSSRFSAQLQSATRYKSLKAVTLQDVDQPSPFVVRDQCYWANCGNSCKGGFTTVPRIDTDASSGEIMEDSYHCQGGTLRQWCCPSSKTIPKCGWFDFYNGSCGKKGACGPGSKMIGPDEKQREVGSTGVACNNGLAQVACCQTEDDSGKALDSMMGYDMCKWYGKATDQCDGTGNDDREEVCRLGDPGHPFYQLETFWGSGATYCWAKGEYQYRGLCCKTPQPHNRWNYCQVHLDDKVGGNFCQAYCPAGTIRLGITSPNNYEGCKGGGHAMCCAPRFLTEANNAAEVHKGYIDALENVISHPENCEWDKVTGTGKNKRNSADFIVDCKAALLGTMNMLGSSDLGIQQKYVNDWNSAVNQLGMYGIDATFMQSQPEGFAYSTAPSAPAQTGIAIGILNVAKKIDADKKKPARVTWDCPSQWVWDATLNWSVDPDDGGEETVDSDFNANSINSRRSLDADADQDISTTPARAASEQVAAAADAGDHSSPRYEAGSDSDDSGYYSDADSAYSESAADFDNVSSPPTDEDWIEGLKRLQEFHTEDSPPASAGPYNTTCQKDDACHAKMLGSDDVSESKGSESYYDIEIEEAKARPRKRYAEILEQRNDQTLQERDSPQLGQPRKYIIPRGNYYIGNWPGEIIESSSYPNGNQGDDLIRVTGDGSRYVVKSTGCGPQDYILKTSAAKGEVNGIWVTEHILELNTIGRFITASLAGGLAGIDDLPPYRLPVPSLHEVEMFTTVFDAWQGHTAISPADSCLVQLGSQQNMKGLVVCDSALNLMKTKVYKLQSPVGETTWNHYCIFATPVSLQRALAYIQGIMAVFDYYADGNVQKRHKLAYQYTMKEMQTFETSYHDQFRGSSISGTWQSRWKFFMKAHFARVGTHARIWTLNKLNDLFLLWNPIVLGCFGSQTPDCLYAMDAVFLIESHRRAINNRQKMFFDVNIFQDLDPNI